MGGLAIKNAFTRRYEKKEFEELTPDVLEKAKTLFTDARITISYRDKDSFGDMDVLCLIDKPITINIEDWIYETFDSKEIFKNGHVYSFEYKELQIDFILVKEKFWNSSITFFSYNDLHNLIGKISKRFGLKWGFKGLVYDYKIGGKKLGTLTLTKDYKEALNFLGFNIDIYDKGFDGVSDIYEYVIASKYFDPYIFDFERVNKINRDRDKKRKTNMGFVNYIQEYKQLPIDTFPYFYKDKKVYLGLIDHYFPGFLKEYRELEKKEEVLQKIKEKFNGNIIMSETGLSGKELGKAIMSFKEHFTSPKFYRDYILENTEEDVMSLFKQINKL